MSHYKPYPTYKDSGVEWIGRVPEHWEVKRLRHFAMLNPSPDWHALQEQQGEYPFFPMEAIGESGELDSSGRKLLDDCRSGYTYFAEGDVAFAKVTPCFENGKGAVLRGLDGGHGFGTTELTVLRPTAVDRDYLYALTLADSFRQPGASEMLGSGGLKRVPDEFTRNYRIAIPPPAEQSAIAAALDRETDRIDALIAKKARFVELLKEKIVALASQPPDSGDLRWIRLSNVCEVISRPVLQQAGSSYIKLGLLNRGRGIFKRGDTDTEDMGDSDFFWVEPGDLILSGQFAWEGAVALAHEEHAGCVVSHRFPVIIGRRDQVLTEYLLAYFLTQHGDFVLNDCSRGSAGRNRPLNMSLLLGWKIPVPSMPIQREVARLVHLERLIGAAVKRSVDLLRERRSALITAAVTGQIDLREAA
jgi:type I restriction enzyme S subunit